MFKIIRLIVVLGVITSVSGLALSYVHKITAEPIEYAQVKLVKAPAVAEVFAGLNPENDPVKDRKKIVVGKDERGRDIVVFAFPLKKGGQVEAVAIETFGAGYHEGLGVMTAIGAAGGNKGKIIRIAITSHHETPGKGDKVERPDFRKQFAGMPADKEVAIGDIDAISGATMSSKGVVEAINKALKIFQTNRDKLLS